uniref:Uncharacterized protein n=1 Tax=Mola mola TaxID=94237 RepID=A0A3Q3W846_MOLML
GYNGFYSADNFFMIAQKKMHYHSKGKTCGYYMRIVFFFSSLIQSLIIVSLVLFLLYGQKPDSASTSRLQELEERFSQLSIDNVALTKQRKNLTILLNTTLSIKARNEWDLARFHYYSNVSAVLIKDMDKKLNRAILSGPCSRSKSDIFSMLIEQMRARIGLVEANFTQTTQRLRREMDQIAKDRDNLNLQAISLRRDKFTHEKEVEFCRQKCKSDFEESLSGVSNVTKAFLKKVDSLFPAHIAFQLTCPKQREHLEQIRSNCSSLSKEVEDKFQHYLNSVGQQVSSIQTENSRLKAENWRMSEDYRWCSQNRSGLIQQHRQTLDKVQQKHDQAMERVLMEKLNLNGEIRVLNNSTSFGSTSSVSRTSSSQSGWNLFGGGGSSSSSSSSSSGSQLSRTGSTLSFGSSGSTYSKPGSTGGLSTNYGSTGSNPSGSTSGTGSNKPTLIGRVSSTSGTTGTNASLSGTGLSRSTTSAKTSSSSSSNGSTSKSNSALSWFGFGSSSSSKSGSGTEKGPSTGNSYGGTGVSGTGRTSGLGAGPGKYK